MSKKIILGTRGSELAQKQTQLVEEALLALNPHLQLERRIINTAGDQRQDIPLCEVNKATQTQDKGVFIAALEEALAAGEIDCAVHSLKDMPGTLDERFTIAAFLPREAIGDVLVVKEGANLDELIIGTSSVRRIRMVESYWSGRARCKTIRGNVGTRLRKLAESDDMGAIILARAGLNRLGYTDKHVVVEGKKLFFVDLSLNSFMPALGQGAVAIEVRRDDKRLLAIISQINDKDTETCVRCERSFLAHLQADCSVPVGGYAELIQETLFFRSIYYTENGAALRVTQRGSKLDPEWLGHNAYEQLQGRLSD